MSYTIDTLQEFIESKLQEIIESKQQPINVTITLSCGVEFSASGMPDDVMRLFERVVEIEGLEPEEEVEDE